MRNKVLVHTRLFLMTFTLFISGCALFGTETAPYAIKGNMTLENEHNEFEAAGINLSLLNKSNKSISEFTVVFSLFDEDGEPVSTGRSNVVISVNTTIQPHELYECCLSLDKFLCEIPESPYFVDYLYISRILYEDNSLWTDAFGIFAN